MKTPSTTLVRLFAAAVLLSGYGLSHAGAVSSNSLGIWNNIATGPLPNARRHNIESGYIGCSVLAYDSDSNVRVYCSAKTPTHFLACYRYNPPEAMLRAVTSIGSASWLEFRKAEGSSQCSEVRVENGSEFM